MIFFIRKIILFLPQIWAWYSPQESFLYYTFICFRVVIAAINVDAKNQFYYDWVKSPWGPRVLIPS